MPASSGPSRPTDAPPPTAIADTNNVHHGPSGSGSSSASASILHASVGGRILPTYYARVVSAPTEVETSSGSSSAPSSARQASSHLTTVTPSTINSAFEGMQMLKGMFGALAPEHATLGLSTSVSSDRPSSSSSSSWTPKAVHARNDAPPSSPSSSSSDPPPSPSSSSSSARKQQAPAPSPADDYDDVPTNQQLSESVEAMFRAYRLNAPAPRHAPQPIPEKCFTWCSQKNDGNAMCRMMCLRRRPPLPTKDEALARLRPAGSPEPDAAAGLGFFAGLKHRLMPYSLIFVKGTPEGVVGRYMEELEGDDGQYDFGPLSRHAPSALRRKSTGRIEWFDWGPTGYILQVPLTSLFAPLLNLPENAERVFGPPFRFLERYVSTFTDGTQERAIQRLAEEIQRGGALEFGERMRAHWRKKAEARKEEYEARVKANEAARAEDAVNAAQTKAAGASVNPPVKDKEGGKGE